jgi:NADH-quinone oxidoreductase subunit C
MQPEASVPEVAVDAVAENMALKGISESLPGAVISQSTDRAGDEVLEIAGQWLVPALQYCKEKLGLDRLSITAVDWYPAEPRFEMVYLLHSVPRSTADYARPVKRLRLKVRVATGEGIDSAFVVYRSADWHEREIFDLFGVEFRNHPNLKRIMMPEDWDGHPLRKDYPIHGFKYSYKDE